MRRSARLALLGLAGACSTPSAEVDPSDLLGVFDAPASSASARSNGSASPSAAVGAPSGTGSAPTVASPRLAARGCVFSLGSATAGAEFGGAGASAPGVRRTEGRPACHGAEVLEWRDAEGAPRYACVYGAREAKPTAPLPLVTFFHAEDADAASVEERTSLRSRLTKAPIAGASRPGFVLLSVQGRALEGARGVSFDVSRADGSNADLAAIDHFHGVLASRGVLDPQRTYALGAGDGGRMAAFYAHARSERVAAFAAFATAGDGGGWSCSEPPPPGLVLYRACDSETPCERVEEWLAVREKLGWDTTSTRLSEASGSEPACLTRAKCTKKRGNVLHVRWPKEREGDVLRFFSQHAVAQPAEPRAP